MPADVLTRRLEALDTAALAELLRRRPDVAPPGAEPNDVGELAGRLVHPYSLVEALHDLTLPAWQLLEAALALGGQPTTSALVEFLDHAGQPDHAREHDVRTISDHLHDLAVLTKVGDRLHLPATLLQIFASPLDLGAPMASLLARTTADTMRTIAGNLGLPRPRTRYDAEQALSEYYADPAKVAQLLDGAPDAVRTVLLTGLADRYHYDPVRDDVLRWAAPLGLVIEVDYAWQVPAEVARALRGPDYRAPFDAHPPPVVSRTATDTGQSAVAATEFLATLLAVLDHLARNPAKSLKSGGLGARELARLVKAVGTSEPAARLALELADVLGQLDTRGGTVTTGPAFDTWRADAPDEQFAAAVQAWWTVGGTPTAARDEDDKPKPVVSGTDRHCALCRLARHAMLDALADVGATDRASLAARVHWWRPAAHTSPADEPLADQWREAELLGVLADGALTPLGQALRAGTDLRDVARALLPAAAHHATFGSDLTVFVVGSPAARVSAVLDSAADREGRGGATTWRFTPGSVRRAFDDGATADGLLAELGAIAQGDLPQPLRYLIGDVARRHGGLRLSAATSVVRSDDIALLAIVAADRALAKHGVRLLAPTVLAADVPVDALLAALRSAGYFPMPDDPTPDDPMPDDPMPGRSDAPAPGARPSNELHNIRTLPVRTPAEPDWHEVAARIQAGRPAAVLGTTVKVLARLTRTLSMGEVRQLAHAVDRRGRVGIDYVATSGSRTRRVIAEPQLFGSSLLAWCELRQDDREFTVSRIVSVYAV